jgi:23S rRNA pseudouridine2605 synthase
MDQEYPRLQKALAAAGVASRRACEEIITQGRVAVNGKVVRELGTKVNPAADDVRVDGVPVFFGNTSKFVYLVLNKPIGVVSTVSDPNAGKTVLELVDQIEERVYPVGRLDADSAGLLLLTNDGDFANKLTHPRYHVPKIYRVRARGFVDRDAALKLAGGIDLPDGRTAPADVRYIEYDAATQCTILDITLYEGRNRQIRRMMDAIEHPVRALTRIGFGNLRLQGLAPGTWRKLRAEEVTDLLELAKPTPTPRKEARRIKLPYRPRNAPRPDAASTPEEQE